MKKEFKVGQVWRTRAGNLCQINNVHDDGFLELKEHNTTNAAFVVADVYLVELVEETEGCPALDIHFPRVDPATAGELPRHKGGRSNAITSFEISELVQMHAQASQQTPARPYPSIIVNKDFAVVYGMNGMMIGETGRTKLKEMKAATGYPVYVMTKHEFAPITVYEVQS